MYNNISTFLSDHHLFWYKKYNEISWWSYPGYKWKCMRQYKAALLLLDTLNFHMAKESFVKGMEPLGADFEKVWDDNAKDLYES